MLKLTNFFLSKDYYFQSSYAVAYNSGMTTHMSLGLTISMMSLVMIGVSFAIFYHLAKPAIAQPSINDSNLTAEIILDGLSSPTSIAFLDNSNILLLEKEGNIRLISNGQMQLEPVLT
ncbi:MAG: hypothetical protein ACRD8Z_12895, partial [Nitrososphaeraceae archaeon]